MPLTYHGQVIRGDTFPTMTPAAYPSIAPPRYPLYVVSGASGSGKTSLINALLALRPPDERWAILLNEEGRTQVNTSSTSHAEVTVRDVAGACACCTGQVVFVTALATLIRRTRPHRVFVEASGQASLDSLLKALHTNFKDAVEVERVIQLSSPTRPVTTMEQTPIEIVTIVGWPNAETLRSLLETRSRDIAASASHSLP